MFGNLKSKIGDVADLKKLASPQSLVGGSRQRSQQHTPRSLTPTSHRSRQASISSLTGLGTPSSPPLSPANLEKFPHGIGMDQELEHEVSKLRLALESQQDAALERLSAKEQEWRTRQQEEKDRASRLAKELQEAIEKQKKLECELEILRSSNQGMSDQLKQAQARVKGLEAKVCEMQDNYDQLEGLNAQEGAKVKHMLLNTNSELDQVRDELNHKNEALVSAETRLVHMGALEERLGVLSEEKTELETKVAGFCQKLRLAEAKCQALEESKEEEVRHLESRVATLEQRHSQTSLQESEKVQAIIREREVMEHSLEEARQQLNNIKASWSTKITALEDQIHHLNTKIVEDQSDLQASEERNHSLTSTLHTLREEVAAVREEKVEVEKQLQAKVEQLQEDVETLRWQLGQKEETEKLLQGQLSAEEEKYRSCTSVLQTKIETIAVLELNLTDLQGKYAELDASMISTREDLQKVQTEKRHLQDSLSRERSATEAAEKCRTELEARLEVVCGEKERLSKNLDEYVEKVNDIEESACELEQMCQEKAERVSHVEARLEEATKECQDLQEQLKTTEADLVHKIEESETVRTLRETVKNLEEELGESKQALKIQRQRLADMKKTIQRELRLTPETNDVTQAPPPVQPTALAVPALAAQAPVSVAGGAEAGSSLFSYQDSQLWESSIPMAGNGPTTATNGNDNTFTVNLTYLKHVIIKYLTSREYEAVHLTRAVATLLHMSPEEEQLLRETLEWKMSWFGTKPNLGKGQRALTIPPSQ